MIFLFVGLITAQGQMLFNIYYMRCINNLKRSDIDKDLELKNLIFSFISMNNLDLDWVSNFKQIIYHYVNKIEEIPRCYCGKNNNFKSSVVGYRKSCSPKCSNNSLNKKIKIMETKLDKYGDENYNNPNKGKMTKLDKYGNENYNNREKAFKTNEIRYGSYSPMKNCDVLKLVKSTKEFRYGNKNYNNIDKIKEFWSNVDFDYLSNFSDKVKNTKLDKYGDENYNNPIKMIKTKLDRYGLYYVNPEKSYDTKVKTGIIKTGDVLKDWELYKNSVKNVTRKNKKKLYEDWNGYDYYDGELIKGYLSYSHIHRFYPTMDHKISVFYGFKNSIDPNFIGSIDNLCITKRFINSTKSKMTEEDFLKS